MRCDVHLAGAEPVFQHCFRRHAQGDSQKGRAIAAPGHGGEDGGYRQKIGGITAQKMLETDFDTSSNRDGCDGEGMTSPSGDIHGGDRIPARSIGMRHGEAGRPGNNKEAFDPASVTVYASL